MGKARRDVESCGRTSLARCPRRKAKTTGNISCSPGKGNGCMALRGLTRLERLEQAGAGWSRLEPAVARVYCTRLGGHESQGGTRTGCLGGVSGLGALWSTGEHCGALWEHTAPALAGTGSRRGA
jgi:hypothetical protein